jgi:pimeloyl-ACP methyl ester carboxylesterase
MIYKIFKWSLVVVVGLVAALFVAALVYRDVPAATVDAKWAQPPSKFIVLDGVRVHYRDEGTGPVIVLIHANYASLFMWEPWAAALKDHYRVIRFDMTAHGLTGVDPTGDYSLERTVAMFEKFADALGLQRFTIGGTSLGGTVGMHFTVKHPERVERLILVSPGSLEKDVRGRSTPREVPRIADVLAYVTPRFLASGLLKLGYGDRSKLTDAVIDEWYEMWMRAGNRPAMLARLRQYVSGDVEAKIRAVQVPVLLLWGEKNPRVPVALAYEFQKLLVNAPSVQLEILKGVGHMAVQEAPQETARRVRAWLDAAPAGAVAPAATPAATPAAMREAAMPLAVVARNGVGASR